MSGPGSGLCYQCYLSPCSSGAQPSPPSPALHQCLTSVIAVGTTGIILQAPSLYDLRPAIDEYLSEIEVAVAKPRGQNNEIY